MFFSPRDDSEFRANGFDYDDLCPSKGVLYVIAGKEQPNLSRTTLCLHSQGVLYKIFHVRLEDGLTNRGFVRQLTLSLAINPHILRIRLPPHPLTLGALFLVSRILSEFLSVTLNPALLLTCQIAANHLIGVVSRRREHLMAVWAFAGEHAF